MRLIVNMYPKKRIHRELNKWPHDTKLNRELWRISCNLPRTSTGGDQPRIFGRSSPFCGRQSRSRNLFLHRRLRTTLVKRSMRAKAHSCFGAWNALGFYIECSSCSSSRRSAGWAVRQTVRTKSTEKRQLGANNLCYVPPHRFPPFIRVSSLSISLSLLSLSFPSSSFLFRPNGVMSFAQD